MMKTPTGCRIPLATGLFVLLLAVLATGCVPGKKTEKKTFYQEWSARAEESVGQSPTIDSQAEFRTVQPEVTIPSVPDVPDEIVDAPERSLPGDRITMRMHDIDVAVLLRALARAAGQNIMINEKVSGRTTINIEDAPWDQVFLGILQTQGLAYEWEGDIIRILTLEDIQKRAQLEEADQKLKISRQQLAASLRSQTLKNELPEIWIYHVKYADAGLLQQSLTTLMKRGAKASKIPGVALPAAPAEALILVDEHTNSLVIEAPRAQLDRFRKLVAELDRPIKQILIEAIIVEANQGTGLELGIQWGGLSKYYAGNDLTHWVSPRADLAATGVTNGQQVDPAAGMMADFGSTAAAALAPPGFNIGYIVQRGAENLLAVQLNALQADGQLNILSTPRIVTQDNQQAIIEAGDEVPVQTVEDGEVKIEYRQAVLRLEVTPHVVEGDVLKLDIKTKKDEVDESREVSGNPYIITKKAETRLVLFDGETTVIGGLSKNREIKRDAGIPWLKDVPILGPLFKGIDNEDTKEELLIFITPYILKERQVGAPPEPGGRTSSP